MKKFHRLFILSIFLLGTTMACKKQNFKDHVGPSICPDENFAYEQQPTLNHTSINLNTQVLNLTAKFNQETPWTVVIRGKSSNSYKKFSGYGSTLDINWYGNPDTVAFFQAEACEAELKIACIDPIVMGFNITQPNRFVNFDYLVYDGDLGALGAGPYAYGDYATHSVSNSLNSPQGGSCYCTDGASAQPVWFFGGFDFTVSLNNNTLNVDPDQVYFNCFVNVKGSQNSIPVVTFTEGTIKRNKNVEVYGDGWHYVSFKLSEANIVNPRNVNTVSFGLNAYPEQGTSGAMCIDFVSFTNKSPFITLYDGGGSNLRCKL
jgi:hypothetical protein